MRLKPASMVAFSIILEVLYVEILCLHTFSDAFDLNFGLVIFRLRAGFDATERMNENPGSHTFMFAMICAANSVL